MDSQERSTTQEERLIFTCPHIFTRPRTYPTFASNALMLSSSEQTPMKSLVVPLTAGPDLGWHNNAHLDIRCLNRTSAMVPNARHPFNGMDVDLDFSSPSTPSAATPTVSFALSQAA
ncbi:uncharacterized protein HD556DRAFT_1471185 [Suillus plorans]|uniref:Uncharacterized protein n=1 Tax=Suillus plorans TaxID=116603 RepID=A0A9P7AT06_9AGAM|nr:uncharacterized protein HD556DRAFT_1471185 [Suillus plorans]KAG1795962.1 hypothetical protein HD556DRAFT_1471185 [Suillus plorans]